jgi:hypothetical protein
MQNLSNNINTSGSGKVAGQILPQMPSVPPRQEKKKRSKAGLIAVVLLVLLVTVSSAGATYFFFSKQAASTGSGVHGAGAQTQPTATVPQTEPTATATNAPTDTPTLQATAASTTVPTVPPTSTWGPGTKNQALTCIVNCDNRDSAFDVTLTSIAIDTKLNSMMWNFSVTDRGNVCADLFGTLKLVDPAGVEIDADGGTFGEHSSIDAGQPLPKTATFSKLPMLGVLYEVKVSVKCGEGFGSPPPDIYRTEHFQR